MSKKLFRSQVHCIRQSDSKTKSWKVPETNKKWWSLSVAFKEFAGGRNTNRGRDAIIRERHDHTEVRALDTWHWTQLQYTLDGKIELRQYNDMNDPSIIYVEKEYFSN